MGHLPSLHSPLFGHTPQSTSTPQPLPVTPHSTPCVSQLSALQVPGPTPQWLATPPPPQVSGVLQVPQLATPPLWPAMPPQPSPTWPPPAPWSVQLAGTHEPPPQWLATPPPPQVCPPVHAAQGAMPLQP